MNKLNELIVKAIVASIEFDAKMNSIDFNSYLLKEEDEVTKTKGYIEYERKLTEATGYCDNIINEIDKKKKNNKSPDVLSDKDVYDLISHLFEAKQIRLEGRKQLRQKEKRKYIDCAHRLHRAFDIIQEKFYNKQKGKSLTDNFNWAKVLYYNEMSICYSGLAESSMSLGYAEESIFLMEELYPELKNLEKRTEDGGGDGFKKLEDRCKGKEDPLSSSHIIKLYTFALYNKGEAERNLHDYDKALLTFNTIIDKCNGKENESPDYYQALFHSALIFIDQGRGEEAITLLKKMRVPEKDTRYGARDLEIASAQIDRKEYIGKEGACAVLKPYDKQEYTFTQRKAKVYKLRLLIEFKKNQPKDFDKPKKRIIKTIKSKYKNFEGTAKILLNECVERYDGDLFKKTCTYLADYFHEESETSKKNKGIELENKIKELGCYYLYLCNEYILKNNGTLRKKYRIEEIINDWIPVDHPDRLEERIDQYNNLVKFSKGFDEVNDERYLKGFFETYFSICMENEYKTSNKEKEIIKKLKERLIAVYHEKDNLIELGEVQEKHSRLEEKLNPTNIVKEDSEKFIRECFFNFEDDKKSIFLYPDSILAKMEHNTRDFAEKIVGKTNRFPNDNKFNAVLTVLRRWNSFTPALASSVNPSKGGGYFLYSQFKNDSYGIVIDPGYDFLENLFSQGYRIGDIDAVIVSHAHPDHTDNLPSILSLFHELNGRLGKYYYSKKLNKQQFNKQQFNKQHIKLIISQGVFDQYYKLIKPSEESLKDIIVVQPGNERVHEQYLVHEFDDNYSIEIEPFATSHGDLIRQWESMGFIINIKKNKETTRTIGYTSDAHWKLDFFKKFKDCHIICAHLGSIVDILGEKGFCSLCGDYDKCEKDPERKENCKEKRFVNGNPTTKKLLKQAQEQNHLYLSGLTMFFDELLPNGKNKNNNMELAIISEFGEELKEGIRMDLFHKFDDWFIERSDGKSKCFPGDIGLEIDLLNGNILCCCCQTFKVKNRISPIAYGKDEAIFFICEECKSVLSPYQIEEKLKDYYENGRHLELEPITDGQVR